MYAGFIPWWKQARMAHAQQMGCGAGHGRWGALVDHLHDALPPEGHRGPWQAHGYGQSEEGSSFGVRRPLRFLAHRLELKEAQVSELARILDELKTERAQASVDDRRAIAAFADAVSGAAFDGAKATEAAKQRSQSAERLNAAVTGALSKIHALLEPEQRDRLAYLVRTGTLSL
jgi:Spy/CpxP family protein refolding chaperone